MPAGFVAVAENVYAVPFVKLLNEQLPDAPLTVHVVGADDGRGDGVTVYEAGVPPAPAVTATVAVAFPYDETVGWFGAPGGEITVSVAALEVVDPLESVTMTRYCAESSADDSVGVVYEAVVAPEPPETLPQEPPLGRTSH